MGFTCAEDSGELVPLPSAAASADIPPSCSITTCDNAPLICSYISTDTKADRMTPNECCCSRSKAAPG
jgi:hypothetical protein